MYSLSTNPGHKPFYVCVSVSVSQQDLTPTTGLLKAIPSFSVHLSSPSCHLVGLLSVRLVCLICGGTKKSRSGCVCSFNKCFFFMQIITLIMLFSTSFPSCLSDKTHQCGLSMAEYTHPWYPVQFSSDRRCSVPESWHTVLCFDDCLDHFLFFPCQDLPVPTPFLLTEWLLLRFSSSV